MLETAQTFILCFGDFSSPILLAQALLHVRIMRRLWLLQMLLLLSFFVVSTAEAGPVTGQPIAPVAGELPGEATSDDEESGSGGELTAFDTSVLFDAMGLPLLRLSAPIYLKLGVASPAVEAPQEGGGGGLGNVGWTPPPIPMPPPPGAVPEPAALLLCLPGAFFALRRLARKSPQRA